MGWLSKSDKLQTFDRSLNAGLFVATTAVLAVVYVLAFQPLDSQLETTRQEADDWGTLVERTAEITRRHRALDDRLSSYRKQASEIWKRIPTAPRESDFLAQVSQLAEKTGMHVADYHPGAVEQTENHHELEVKIATRGEYKALCKFLEQVDQIPRLSRMTHIDVNTQPDQILTVDLTYRIYFAPPAAGAAKKG